VTSDMVADSSPELGRRMLVRPYRCSVLLMLAVVGSVNAPDITVQIS